MSNAEVSQDQSQSDYDQFVAGLEGRTQPASIAEKVAAIESESDASDEESKTETESDPGTKVTQEDEPHWTPAQQKRLDKLTRDKYELRGITKSQEAELARLRAELAETRKGKPEAAAAAQPLKRPRISDFQDVAQYEDALDRYEEAVDKARDEKYRREFHGELQRVQEAQTRQASEQFAREFVEKAEEFTKTHDDYPQTESLVAERVANRQRIDFAITNQPNAHQLIYHLGKNPKDLQAILSQHDDLALIQIGRLAASLDAPEVKLPKRTSSPPPPGRVTGATARTNPEDSDNWEDFKRGEDAKLRAR